MVEQTQYAEEGGGRGHVGGKFLRKFERGIILVRNLLRQAKTRYRVPVQLAIPQGTGEFSSADHTGLQSRERDFICLKLGVYL